MSGASDILDPVEAAQDDIVRSKHLIASTLDDLTRHHSWLESYHREERRRAQRLRRQEALRRLELRRQRAAWRLRRLALTSLAATRATAGFLRTNSAAFVAWAAPRVHALSLLLLRWTSAALAWSWQTISSLARMGFEASVRALAWAVRSSESLGIAFRARLSADLALLSARAAVLAEPGLNRASIGWSRIRRRWQRSIITLRRRALDSWSWTRSEAPAVARFLVASTATNGGVVLRNAHENARAFADWALVRSSQLAFAARRALLELQSRFAARARRSSEDPSLRHRALIPKPCTAIVCVEPWRARLPVVRPN